MHLNSVPVVISAYSRLGVKHEPLRLIPPKFETPLPPLQPAVFPPVLQELPAPPLELFDLEEAFSSERTKLAQAANKYLSSSTAADPDSELQLFALECIHALGMPAKDLRHGLHQLAKEMFQFKRTTLDD